MIPSQTFSAFISYTGEDLAGHADVVASVLRKLRVTPIDHRDSGATGEPSLVWCKAEVEKADILIVLVAHRYGWIPELKDGGDEVKSITWLEVEYARKAGRIVLPYLLGETETWQVNLVEGLTNPRVLDSLATFKKELRSSIAAFFSDPKSLDGPISRDVPKALEKLAAKQRPTAEVLNDQLGAHPSVPWLYDREFPPSVMTRMKPEIPKRILALEGGVLIV